MSIEIEEGHRRRSSSSSSSSAQAASTFDPETRVKSNALAVALGNVQLFLLALWLGAAMFFSFVVAPSVFILLRAQAVPYANAVAGSIVTRTLSIVNMSGFLISAALILISLLITRKVTGRRALTMEMISLALVAVATSAGQWIIAARMLALRTAMGRPIDDVAPNDPLRLAFNSLHGYSVIALTVGMLAALVAWVLIARRRRLYSA